MTTNRPASSASSNRTHVEPCRARGIGPDAGLDLCLDVCLDLWVGES